LILQIIAAILQDTINSSLLTFTGGSIMSSLASLFVLVAASVGAEAAQQANSLQDYADDLCGTWACEVTIQEDNPDLKLKKGQKVKAEIEVEWAVEQAVLEWEISLEGMGTVAKGIVGQHPPEKPIMGLWYSRAGKGQYEASKEGNTWIEEGEFVDREGKKHSTQTTIEVKDKNTHIRQRTVDGEANPPNTWTRK